jgi:uncharacterized protein YcgI (DUF1989 family)
MRVFVFVCVVLVVLAMCGCGKQVQRICIKWREQPVVIEYFNGEQALIRRYVCEQWEDELQVEQ